MRIVQTFWTAGQDPLKYAFGWTHPEYNLMSWALSCLSMREHYDEVELYTDSAGYHILIETLKLPYTKVHVVFDDFECLPHHWALAKIKTYSMQTEPFLHVDGDVYVPKPLPLSLYLKDDIAFLLEISWKESPIINGVPTSKIEIKLLDYEVQPNSGLLFIESFFRAVGHWNKSSAIRIDVMYAYENTILRYTKSRMIQKYIQG